MATWSAGGDGYAPKTANSDATYVKLKPTDSAASGTAFASGVKTYDAAINVDMNSIPLLTITQRAESLGKSAGVVSTVQISHATPARLIGIAQVATTLQQVRAGGAADWAGHANQSARLIEEQMDFNVAVDSVIKWIEAHGGFEENLLIVTGDHETGYLTGENTTIAADTSARVYPVQNKGKGNMPGMQWNSGDHTNQLIPLFAKGAGSESITKQADEWDPQHGYFGDNAKVGQVMQMQYFLGTLPTPRVDEQVKTTQKISPLTTQLQVVGSLAMLQMSRSDVVRLSLYSTDGTRQHVLFNGYAQAGTQVFQIPRTTGIAMLVLETSTGKQVRNISNIK